VTGVAAGAAWIVAASEGVRDSLQVTVTACAWCNVTATLNGGVLPSGWVSGGFIGNVGGGQVPLLRNDRIEGQQTDRGTEVGAPGAPPAGTAEIEISWSENIPSSSSGTYSALSLPTTAGGLWVLPISNNAGPAGFYSYISNLSQSFTGIGGFAAAGGNTATQTDDRRPLTMTQDVRTTVVLRSDSLWFTYRNLATSQVLARLRRGVAGFNLADIRGMFLTAYQTTGAIKWVDSIVTITRTSTTPQPAIINNIVISGATSVATGATTALSATPMDNLGSPIAGRTIAWSTSNAAIATVTSGGVVTGVAAGTVFIRATSEGRTDSVQVAIGLPNLVVENISLPQGLSAGKTINVTNIAQLRNSGVGGSASTHTTGFYLSTDQIITTSDIYLGGSSAAPVPAAGNAIAMSDNLAVPTTVTPGQYYLGVIVDQTGVITESDEANAFSSTTTIFVAARQVVLLTRGADTTTNWVRNALTGAGVPFREVTTSAVTASDLSRAVIIPAFTNDPTELSSTGSTFASAISGGSWAVSLGLGFRVYVNAGWGTAASASWSPFANDGGYFVRAFDTGNSLFSGIASWDPPTTPDRPAQLVGFVNNGSRAVVNYVNPTTLTSDANSFWSLGTTYGWSGQATTSTYCTQWGGCTGERSVNEGEFRVFRPGTGRFLNAGTHPSSYYNYGPVTRQVILNFVNLGRTTP
jgi:hypothetical protein